MELIEIIIAFIFITTAITLILIGGVFLAFKKPLPPSKKASKIYYNLLRNNGFQKNCNKQQALRNYIVRCKD